MNLLGAVSLTDTVLRAICACAAAWLGLYIFTMSLAWYATARFWEPWVRSYGMPAMVAGGVATAILSGLVVGLAIGALFRHYALRVGALAAILEVVYSAIHETASPSAFAYFDLLLPIAIAAGLIAGAGVAAWIRARRRLAT